MALRILIFLVLPCFGSCGSTCIEDLTQLTDSNEEWAAKVLRSWGRLPTELTPTDYGDYDQCREFVVEQKYNVKYCLVPFTFNNVSLNIGLCLPKSCKKAEELFNSTAILDETNCYLSPEINFSVIDYCIMVVVGLQISLVLIATVMESKGMKENYPYFMAFSLKSNMKLFTTDNVNGLQIQCLNGIRTFAMMWVVLIHVEQPLPFVAYAGGTSSHSTRSKAWYNIIRSGQIAIDIRLVMGACSISYQFFTSKNSWKDVSFFQFYVRRYIRLVPCATFVILSYRLIISNFDGPNIPFIRSEQAGSKAYWWTYMFFVRQYLTNQTPLMHLWFLTLDVQLYLLAPPVLFVLKKFSFKMYPAVLLLLVPSIYVVLSTDAGSRNAVFYATHTRYTPWIIGLLLGHFLSVQETKKTKPRFWVICLAWVISISYLFFLINVVRSVHIPFLHALHRPLCGFCVAWVVISCKLGYSEPINRFLSKKVFQPLAVLSYSMFIAHFPILKVIRMTQRAPIYRNEWLLSIDILQDIAISFVAAVPISLFFEFPWPMLYCKYMNRNCKSDEGLRATTNEVGIDADIDCDPAFD